MRTLPYDLESLSVSFTRDRLNCSPRRHRIVFARLLFAFFFLVAFAHSALSAKPIPKTLDAAPTQALPNHLPRWANSANDAGLVASTQTLDPMTIVLARSPQQEAAFAQFLADQQNPASPDYHRWLTPAQVGERFGLSADSVAAVTGWLRSQGLHVTWVAPSRMFIGFTGAAGDLGRAFQTEFHSYKVDGVERISVSSDPIVPAALAPLIKAVSGLYTVEDRPAHHMTALQSDSPYLTTGNGSHFITPTDFAAIYDLPNYSGAGVTIGIVGRSRTDFADFSNFQGLTGAYFSNPTEVIPTAFGGIDPGPALNAPPAAGVSSGDQGEATLDVLRAGSVARSANLLLVVSTNAGGGVESDAQYLVQTTPVPAQVMTISFGECESAAGPTRVAFWDALFQQGAAEGISSFVSSGDAGASGCDANFAAPPASPQPNSPNYICSSSYVTCVGGTEFNDASDPSAYWRSTNSGLSSAIGYIPEGAWNEPLSSTSTPQAASSGGGVSTVVATPAWQTGTGVPVARSGRYTPDIAFSASGHDAYFACFAAGGGSCVLSNGSFYFVGFGGTSAAAPAMAGIAAQLDQESGAPQGNLNSEIYAMAAASPSAFHDVTVATSGVTNCSLNTPSMCNNSLPASNSLTGGQAGYLVGAGYDQVTGLGSLDVASFITNYKSPWIAPTVTVTPSPTTITAIQPLTVAIAVGGGNNNPTPTGSVQLASGNYLSAPMTLSNGVAAFVLPAGTLSASMDQQSLSATYTPDSSSESTYRSATGSAFVNVSFLVPTVTLTPPTSSITTAQPLTLTVSVGGGTGAPMPTGTIYLQGGGYYSGPETLAGGTAGFSIAAGLLAPGIDDLGAYYTPDAMSSPVYQSTLENSSVTVTATAALTPTVTVTPASMDLAEAQTLPVTIAVSGGTGNPTPTGSVTLVSGSYSSGPVALINGDASITVPAQSLVVGIDSLTAIYAPDPASASIYNNTAGFTNVSVINLAKSAPAVVLSLSSTTIDTAQALSVTIDVTGFVLPGTGTVTLSCGAYTSAATTLSAGSVTIVVPAGALATGTDTLTAAYTPDAASAPVFFATSSTTTVTVAPPGFSIGFQSQFLSTLAGATSGNTATITVSPGIGFTGSVALTAAITSSPVGAQDLPTLSFGATSPVTLSSTDPATATLTVSTTPATSAALAHPTHPGIPWYATGGAALACLFLFGIPARRRRVRNLLGMLALFAFLACGVLACGGAGGGNSGGGTGGGGGGGGAGTPATTPGTYTITVTGTSGATTATGTVILNVQ